MRTLLLTTTILAAGAFALGDALAQQAQQPEQMQPQQAQQAQRPGQAGQQQALAEIRRDIDGILVVLREQGEQGLDQARDRLTQLRSQLDRPEMREQLGPQFEQIRASIDRAAQAAEQRNAQEAVVALQEVDGVIAELERGAEPTQIVLEQPGAQVDVRQPEPQVAIQQAQPQVEVQQPQPQIQVTQPPPEVDVQVRVPKPQVEVRVPEPQVSVQQTQPQVEVRVPEPQVSVQQPEPRVRVEQGQPDVDVQQAEPEVQVTQTEPRVQVEQAQPQVTVRRPEGQPADVDVQVQRAQPGEQARAEQQQPTRAAGMTQQQLSGIIGMQIVGANGNEIGEVKDVLLGADGEVERIIIERGGFLGVGENRYAINWQDVQLDPDADRVVATGLTEQELENLPQFRYTGTENALVGG